MISLGPSSARRRWGGGEKRGGGSGAGEKNDSAAQQVDARNRFKSARFGTFTLSSRALVLALPVRLRAAPLAASESSVAKLGCRNSFPPPPPISLSPLPPFASLASPPCPSFFPRPVRRVAPDRSPHRLSMLSRRRPLRSSHLSVQPFRRLASCSPPVSYSHSPPSSTSPYPQLVLRLASTLLDSPVRIPIDCTFVRLLGPIRRIPPVLRDPDHRAA